MRISLSPRFVAILSIAFASLSMLAANSWGANEPAPEKSDSGWIDLVTVFGLDGEPVAGCPVEVRRTPLGAAIEEERGLDLSPPLHSLKTTSEGVVPLPDLPPGSYQVRVERPGEFGEVTVHSPDPDSLTVDQAKRWRERDRRNMLGLRSARFVEVQVVDPEGGPLSDSIVLLVDPDSGDPAPSNFQETNRDLVPHGMSDANGRVRFVLYPDSMGSARRLRAIGLRYGAEPVEQTERVDLAGGSITLTMPPTVALRLAFSEEEDQEGSMLWAARERFAIGHGSHVSFEPGTRHVDVLDMIVSQWRVALPAGGRTVRAFAPGATVTFVARVAGRADASTTVTLTDELLQAPTIVAGPGRAHLRLRLVDENGTPRGHRDLRLEIARPGEPPIRVYPQVEATPKGPAIVAIIDPAVTGEFRVLRASQGPSWLDERPPLASAPLPPLTPKGTVDLGVFQIARPPVLVSGRVFDAYGKPIGGVGVVTYGERVTEARTSPRDRDRQWGVSAADGTFEIRAEPLEPPVNYTLSVGGMYRAREISFQPGDRNLELEVSSTGAIAGRVRSAHTELADQVELSLLREEQRVSTIFGRDPDGRFHVGRLETGEYTVQVKLAGILVEEVKGVFVHENGVATPSELANAIVGKDFKFGEVRVLDADGEPLVGVGISLASANDEDAPPFLGDRSVETDADGFARVVYRANERLELQVTPFLSHDPRADSLRKKTIVAPRFPLEVKLESSAKRKSGSSPR